LLIENVDFDIDTAIKVLRQSGYYKQALNLCEKHLKHEDYIKIQLEYLNDHTKSLDYIRVLDDDFAIENLKLYGKVLMKNIPNETVVFLKKLCSKTDGR
jgi:hypothetical protein